MLNMIKLDKLNVVVKRKTFSFNLHGIFEANEIYSHSLLFFMRLNLRTYDLQVFLLMRAAISLNEFFI